jgi:hypothetical protein
MSLSAKRQAELRAAKKKLEPAKVFPRKRCLNCDTPFPKTHPKKKFCCDNCRKEFHANGGNAFGPLKTRLEKLVRQITAELQREVSRLAARVSNLESQIDSQAVERFLKP